MGSEQLGYDYDCDMVFFESNFSFKQWYRKFFPKLDLSLQMFDASFDLQSVGFKLCSAIKLLHRPNNTVWAT